jgi:hypothetical protein
MVWSRSGSYFSGRSGSELANVKCTIHIRTAARLLKQFKDVSGNMFVSKANWNNFEEKIRKNELNYTDFLVKVVRSGSRFGSGTDIPDPNPTWQKVPEPTGSGSTTQFI